MTPRVVRLLRGASTAAVAIVTAAVAHVLGGGDAPSVFGIALAAMLAVPFCTFVATVRDSWPRLVSGVVATQALLHAVFSWGDGRTPVGVITAHGHHDVIRITGADAHVATGEWHGMGWAHVLAVVVAIAVLRWGERAASTAIRAARARRGAPDLEQPLRTPTAGRTRPVPGPVRSTLPRHVVVAPSLRGPPPSVPTTA